MDANEMIDVLHRHWKNRPLPGEPYVDLPTHTIRDRANRDQWVTFRALQMEPDRFHPQLVAMMRAALAE